jgi:excisionase family DNA binding protein
MSEPSKKIVSLRLQPAVEIVSRLERLEDSFLTGLQEIRAVKAELQKQADTTPGLEKLLDAKTVAELLDESERWVYQQAKKKQIPSIRLGKYWKFSPSELQKWLDRQQNFDRYYGTMILLSHENQKGGKADASNSSAVRA